MLVGGDGGYIYSWARKPVLRGLERFKCVGLLWDGIFWSCRLVEYSLLIYDEACSYIYSAAHPPRTSIYAEFVSHPSSCPTVTCATHL